MSLARQTGEDQLIWGSLNNIASLLSDYKGDLPQAEATYRQLVEIDRNSGKKWRMDFTLSNLGAVLTEEGHLAEARRLLTEVQDRSFKSTGHPAISAAARSRLAEIDVAEGRPQDAEARLLPMAKVLEEDQHGFAVTYYDEIAAAQLAENKPLEAQRTAAHARQLLGGTEDRLRYSYHLAITEAKLAAALHPEIRMCLARSLVRLREITAQCSKSGFYSLELEARLAEGEIEMRSGED